MILLDSDVLIDLLRNYRSAIEWFDSLHEDEELLVSGYVVADLVGLSKRAFMELLGDYDVAIVNYPASELDGDIINAYKITTNHANQQLFTQVLSN